MSAYQACFFTFYRFHVKGLDVAFLVDCLNLQFELLKSVTRLHPCHFRTISSLSVDSLFLNCIDPVSGKLLKIQMLSERFFNKLEPLLKGGLASVFAHYASFNLGSKLLDKMVTNGSYIDCNALYASILSGMISLYFYIIFI